MSKCKDCTERYVGCHSDCPDYAAFKASLDAAADKKRVAKKAAEDVTRYKIDIVRGFLKNRWRQF